MKKNKINKYDLSYKKLIIFAIISGIYTAVMAILPIFKDTSFADITVSFEVWILFGILIIMNSKSAKDSALKCFTFFLISQPLVYLLQIPFSDMGLGLFGYYKYWFIWTIFTLPMGYIGYYLRKDKWWGIFILLPILLFLGVHYSMFLKNVIFSFPNHLLSTIFCLVTMLFYPIYIFKNKKNRIVCFSISALILIAMTVFSFLKPNIYSTDVLVSNGKLDVVFDDSFSVYLSNNRMGDVQIKYSNGYDDYCVSGKFKKAGKTDLILKDEKGNEYNFELNVKNNSYSIVKK